MKTKNHINLWFVAICSASRTAFQSNAVLTAGEHISRNQVTSAMEQEDTVALTAEECSPH